jgi:hypothetical protein
MLPLGCFDRDFMATAKQRSDPVPAGYETLGVHLQAGVELVAARNSVFYKGRRGPTSGLRSRPRPTCSVGVWS